MTESDIRQFCIELKTLLKKYNVTIGAQITGDIFGVDCNFVVFDNQTDQTIILDNYSSYLDAYDLDNFLMRQTGR